MILGIVAGLAAGALWGLTFVAPRAVLPFSAADLALWRYGLFGLLSLALMACDARFRPARRHLTPRLLGLALLLGCLGYVGYALLVAGAVALAGPAIPPVVIGALPVLLAILGNWRDRDVPWRELAAPLALIAAGIATVNGAALHESPDAGAAGAVLAGTGLAVAALALWIVYALLNARTIRAENAPGVLPWTGLQGIGAAVGALALLPWTSWAGGPPPPPLAGPEGLRFLGWAVLLATAGSWLAALGWVVASRRLSLALSAQLIVAEGVFALGYGFAWEGRAPTVAEAVGAALQVAGVSAAIRLFGRRHRKEAARRRTGTA